MNVETPFGTVVVSVTNGNRLFCDASGNGKFITINGVRVSTSFSIVKVNGSWTNTGEMVYSRRTDDFRDATPAARRKIAQVLIPFLCEWANNNIDTTELAAAEHKAQSNQLLSLNAQIDRLTDELNELLNKREDVIAAMSAAKEAMSG